MEPIPRDAVASVGVVKLDHLGDLVLATPVFRALRGAFPRARIAAVAGPWAAAVLKNNPFIDEVIPYAAEWLDRERSAHDPARQRACRETLARLAAAPFDLVVNLRDEPIHFPFANALCGRWLLSYADAAHARLVTHPVPRGPRPLHAVEEHRVLLAAIGVPMEGGPELFPSAADEARAAELLGGRPFWVALAPGAGWEGRRWPDEKYVALARELAAREIPCCVVGTAGERLGPRLAAEAGAVDLCGRTSIPVLAAVLRRAAVTVGSDSGPIHVAAAMGGWTVDLLPPRSRPSLLPFTPRRRLLGSEACARPCQGFWRFQPDPSVGADACRCIGEVPVDRVRDAVFACLIEAHEAGALRPEARVAHPFHPCTFPTTA